MTAERGQARRGAPSPSHPRPRCILTTEPWRRRPYPIPKAVPPPMWGVVRMRTERGTARRGAELLRQPHGCERRRGRSAPRLAGSSHPPSSRPGRVPCRWPPRCPPRGPGNEPRRTPDCRTPGSPAAPLADRDKPRPSCGTPQQSQPGRDTSQGQGPDDPRRTRRLHAKAPVGGSLSPALKRSYPERTRSMFSCDIAYSDSPTASSAAALEVYACQ